MNMMWCFFGFVACSIIVALLCRYAPLIEESDEIDELTKMDCDEMLAEKPNDPQ